MEESEKHQFWPDHQRNIDHFAGNCQGYIASQVTTIATSNLFFVVPFDNSISRLRLGGALQNPLQKLIFR